MAKETEKKTRKHFDASQIVRKAENTTSDRSKRYLRWLCKKGIEKLIIPKIEGKENYNELLEEYIDRYEYELEVIEGMGYVDYFLIVQDYVNYAKNNGMPTGPGRGCLVPSTMIQTPTGNVSLAEIFVGDTVFDECGDECRVLEKFTYNITEPLVELFTEYGSVKLTKDHRIPQIKNGKINWIEAYEIATGDKVLHYNNGEITETVIKDISIFDYAGEVMDLMVNTFNEPSYATTSCIVHNSAAGSLVSYLTGITSVDPIPYGLFFERFLNPGRKGMPDIDIDFPQSKRQEIIAHIRELYGSERVAQIATFSYMAARGAVRDSARILGFAPDFGDRISKMISDKPKAKIADDLVEGTELYAIYRQDPNAKLVIDTALSIEGLIRQGSIHASALVIAPVDITDKMPLQTPKKSQMAKNAQNSTDMSSLLVQFDGPTVESLGYLKMDILGLGTLDVIENTLNFIKKTRGIHLTLDQIPFDDEKTFELLSSGDTNGVFQVESNGMKDVLKLIKPKRFEEIGDIIALYRPGPMEYIPAYKAGKDDPEGIKYLVPELKPILDDTYGVACIAKGTPILTWTGEIPIEDIEPGMMVLTEDGTYKKVLNRYYQGRKGTVILTTFENHKLRCTPDHRILTKRGWVEAENLLGSDEIKIYNVVSQDDVPEETWTHLEKIEVVSIEDVYDLSVETNHSFVANGIVVHNCYQEQLMEVAKNIGGFTLAEADDLRKAISKKKAELLAKLEEKFFNGCRANGIAEKKIPELWKLMEAASGYSFNKSHAFCYAVLSYQTAYLKANYPTEFMSSLMTYKKDDQDSIKEYINDCKRMKINVVPPHINYSSTNFDITPSGDIIFGLSALKGVGYGPALDIINERENKGLFKDLNDFLNRVKVNSRVYEILAKSSALDNLGWTKKALIFEKDRVVEFIKNINKKQDFGLQGGFDFFDEIETAKIAPKITDEFDDDVLLEFENEMLGMYLTGHPIQYYELSRRLKMKGLPARQLFNLGDLPNLKNRDEVYTFGAVSRIHRFESKKGWMAFVTLMDFGVGQHSYMGNDPKIYTFDTVLFTEAYNQWGYRMNENDFVFIQGTMNERKDTGALSLIANNVSFLGKDKEIEYQSDPVMRKIVMDVLNELEQEKLALQNGISPELNSSEEDVIVEEVVEEEEVVSNKSSEDIPTKVVFGANDENALPLLKIIKRNPGTMPYIIKINGEVLDIEDEMDFPKGISLNNKVKMALDFAKIKYNMEEIG